MKKKSIALFAAMAVFVFTGCSPDPDPEKSDAAVITAISLGAFAADPAPSPISRAEWNAAADGDLADFDASYTGKITVDQDSDIGGSLSVTASPGAKKEYVLGEADLFKPQGAFSATVPALNKTKPLFIKVTSENGKTVNFYRVRIQTRILPAEARVPNITTHPVNGFYEPPGSNSPPELLTVEAESPDGGVISYQWFSSNTNSYDDGTEIAGQTGTSFQPASTNDGVKTYYWAEVTNTNNQVTGETKSRTIASRMALIVRFNAPAIEMITSGGSSSPVFRFELPEGETWGDYKKLTYKVMIADQTSWDQPNTRAYVSGTYGSSNFQNGKYTQGNWGSHRLVIMELSPLSKLLSSTDNPAVTAGATGPMKWATFEHDITDSTTWKGGFHNPVATHPGPFYFAFGPTINQNNKRDGRIKYYIKDIYLVKENGGKTQADKFLDHRVSYGADVVQQEAVAEPQEQN
jgi:hypothetical protein